MRRHRFLASECCTVFQSGVCAADEDNTCFYKNPNARCRIVLNSTLNKLLFSLGKTREWQGVHFQAWLLRCIASTHANELGRIRAPKLGCVDKAPGQTAQMHHRFCAVFPPLSSGSKILGLYGLCTYLGSICHYVFRILRQNMSSSTAWKEVNGTFRTSCTGNPQGNGKNGRRGLVADALAIQITVNVAIECDMVNPRELAWGRFANCLSAGRLNTEHNDYWREKYRTLFKALDKYDPCMADSEVEKSERADLSNLPWWNEAVERKYSGRCIVRKRFFYNGMESA